MVLAEIVQDPAPETQAGLAVVHHPVQAIQVLADPFLLLLLRQLAFPGGVLHKPLGGIHIPGGVEEDALRSGSIPACPARLLIIGLQALGHGIVDHIGYVGLVDAHAESVGSHHDVGPVVDEILLVFLALPLRQTGVIAGSPDVTGPEELADGLHILAGGAVDNAGLVPPLPKELQQLRVFVLGVADLEAQIGPVEACGHPLRVMEVQNFLNVFPDPGSGCGRKGGDHRAMGEDLQKVHNFQVAGPEILAPLGNAVGLVYRHQGNGPGLDGLQKAVCQKPLRGYIDDLVHTALDVPVHQADLVGCQGGIDVGRADSRVLQGHDLVLHERNQGGDDQCHPRQHKPRHLVAQALAAAGGHDAEGIPAGKLGVDELLLAGPEGGVAEVLL